MRAKGRLVAWGEAKYGLGKHGNDGVGSPRLKFPLSCLPARANAGTSLCPVSPLSMTVLSSWEI